MGKKKRKKAGLPPGTLIYTGKKKGIPPNVILLQYDPEAIFEYSMKDQLPEPQPGAYTNWYDVRGLHNIVLIETLGQRFNIHPLVLEDVLNTQQRPKMEEYPNGIFFIVEALTWDAGNCALKTEQVGIYTTEDWVITFQEDEDDLFPSVRERLHTGKGRIRQRGPDYLTYALIDHIIDYYYIILDQIEEEIELLEQEILTTPKAETKARIHKVKTAVLRMRKAVGPSREAISRLYRINHPVFKEETAVFIRDLHDHIAQITDSIETYRDMINGLYDLYLSEISFKMNNIMQILTIISTIFIPLTFLVGVYGMNFDHMPELHGRYSYFALWGIMGLIFVAQLLFFRSRRWL